MRFSLENAIDQFIFKDAELTAFMFGDNISVEVVGAIGKATNPLNEEFVDRYIELLAMHFMDAKIVSIYEEGYKYYDANDVLLEEVADQEISPLEYESIIKDCLSNKSYWFHYENLEKEDERFRYLFFLDKEVGDETTTYLITLEFSKVIFEWENFQNRVMG